MFVGNRIELRQRQFRQNARIILMQELQILFDKKESQVRYFLQTTLIILLERLKIHYYEKHRVLFYGKTFGSSL